MNASENCINLIKEYEGVRLQSYLCPAGKWTIGYGSTRWIDGSTVLSGQRINMDMANSLLKYHISQIEKRIPDLGFNQNQFDAVISFCFNIGLSGFMNSTMHRKMKTNVNDITIRDEFMKWTKARVKGKLTELRGLVNRRKAEADLYFKPINNFAFS